ncbi:MAG: archaellum component FlaG (FlaF/FlaG flagellin family) [Saprospiraceae bacterium]
MSPGYPDGNYEIRAVADCGADLTYSNIVPGVIGRTGLLLLGAPQPSDGIWTEGDEIAFRFNKNLDCPLIDVDSMQIINKSKGDAAVAFTMTCFDNELVFVLDSAMSTFDGDTLEVRVDAVDAVNGSSLLQPENWTFEVITQDLYFEKKRIQVTMYEGESQTLSVRLESTKQIGNVGDVSIIDKAAPMGSWLNWLPDESFSVTPTGTSIDFILDAKEVGTFKDTVIVDGLTGRIPELIIELTVLPKAPHWVLNGSYANSMVMVANWQFRDMITGNIPDDITKDSMDQISVWIDGEVRGLANITKVTDEFYAAYLTIFGQAADEGKTLDFRIWDASEGNEYDGHPSNAIMFEANDIIGNTAVPRMLTVDRENDQARYIPLNPNWT